MSGLWFCIGLLGGGAIALFSFGVAVKVVTRTMIEMMDMSVEEFSAFHQRLEGISSKRKSFSERLAEVQKKKNTEAPSPGEGKAF